MTVDLIIATLPDKTPAQRATMRKNAEEKLETGSPDIHKAAQKLLDALDALDASEQVAQADWVANASMAERVKMAFTRMPPSETDVRLLKVMLENPGSTSDALSEKLGWGGQAWHMHFGKMCQAREVWLWPEAEEDKKNGHFYCSVLTNFDPDGSRFTMKPEVVTALHGLGIVGKSRPATG